MKEVLELVLIMIIVVIMIIVYKGFHEGVTLKIDGTVHTFQVK